MLQNSIGINPQQQDSIKILSYNILASCYQIQEWIPESSKQFLDFEYRKKLIIKNIATLNPDIINLQEVDNYEEFYKNEIQNLGYEVHYQLKSERKEGIVIGFKRDKFKLKAKHILEFANIQIPKEISISKKYNGRILKPNIAMILELEMIGAKNSEKKKIVASNTHLFWDPRQSYIKYLQACHLLEFINKNYSTDDFIFMSGDFNSIPLCDTTAFIQDKKRPYFENTHILERDKIKPVHIQIMGKMYDYYVDKCVLNFNNPYSEKQEELQNRDIQIYKNYPENEKYNAQYSNGEVTSIYGQKNQEIFTCFCPTAQLCLDYIYYNQNPKLKLKGVLELMHLECILKGELNGIIPSDKYPSDHFPIMAEFSISAD